MLLGGSAAVAATAVADTRIAQAQPRPAAPAQAPAATAPAAGGAQGRPNILVIFGDDVGWANISAYNMGMMGYRTPNIDRIAREGAMFTDHYAENSCTAGRSAFITGQSPFRTGLSKVGLPGADLGMKPEDPTIAALLKPLGYATGQFGKNHLGDRDEHLPTMHGFDEFFGNLYHLNAEEEPENADYPRNPEFRRRFGPRGVLKTWANAGRHAAHREHRAADAASGCRRWTRSSSTPRSTSSIASTAPAGPSSPGSTRRACTSTRTCGRRARARPGSASTPTAWSSMTAMSAVC